MNKLMLSGQEFLQLATDWVHYGNDQSRRNMFQCPFGIADVHYASHLKIFNWEVWNSNTSDREPNYKGYCLTKEEAMEKCDTKLIEMGWKFADNKFKVMG